MANGLSTNPQTFGIDNLSSPAHTRPVYLDCNATTPIDPAVREVVLHYLLDEFGNAGSRTHLYGTRANQAVQRAREQVARVVDSQRDDVVFTSGATESNNLAILGLGPFGEREGRRHIVSTQIEHKAVLEPLNALSRRGFEVTLVPPTPGGWVEADAVLDAVRSDTLLVSVMHVNNETGVIQPIAEIADRLGDHPAFLHTDAAQGFGKELDQLRHLRIDMISLSGHKLYAPKGVGALILRRRGFKRPPLSPLMYGGGQERGLRPGTLPVPLTAGLGVAAELALSRNAEWWSDCERLRASILKAIEPLQPQFNAPIERTLPNTLNFSLIGLDSEAAMLGLRDLIALSNGSACTSQSYEPSHVLRAMGLSDERVSSSLRWSWCHMSIQPNFRAVVEALTSLRQ